MGQQTARSSRSSSEFRKPFEQQLCANIGSFELVGQYYTGVDKSVVIAALACPSMLLYGEISPAGLQQVSCETVPQCVA